MGKERVEWLGGRRSDVSGRVCEEFLVDGRTRGGPWAVMTVDEHARLGVGLGVGRGQLYKRDGEGRYWKVCGDCAQSED